MKKRVEKLLKRIKLECFGTKFKLVCEIDKVFGGRYYLQIHYNASCNKTGEMQEWHSGKRYLSEHMTDDEVVKQAYSLFETTVKHEIMEGFTIDNIPLFNPHTHYEELLKVSLNEISRR